MPCCPAKAETHPERDHANIPLERLTLRRCQFHPAPTGYRFLADHRAAVPRAGRSPRSA